MHNGSTFYTNFNIKEGWGGLEITQKLSTLFQDKMILLLLIDSALPYRLAFIQVDYCGQIHTCLLFINIYIGVLQKVDYCGHIYAVLMWRIQYHKSKQVQVEYIERKFKRVLICPFIFWPKTSEPTCLFLRIYSTNILTHLTCQKYMSAKNNICYIYFILFKRQQYLLVLIITTTIHQ